MQPSSAQLQELTAATGIPDFSAVTLKQFTEVVYKAAKKSLTLERLRLLVGVMPQFIQLQGEIIGGLKKIAEGAQSGQQAAMQAVGRSFDTLNSLQETLCVLAQGSQTDESRLEIARVAVKAGELGIRLARIIHLI